MTPPVADPSLPVRVFVYGTLKRGGHYHNSHCAGALRIRPALVQGRVVDRPEGYPTLFVPPSLMLLRGTKNYPADGALCHTAALSAGCTLQSYLTPSRPWSLVRGELVDFPAHGTALGPLDALEEYVPDGPSLYHRVLCPLLAEGVLTFGWVYCSPFSHRFFTVYGSKGSTAA